ncbi:MAG: DHH family phosphoesterase, partial [Candidatus Pacearchaeota archaeon]
MDKVEFSIGNEKKFHAFISGLDKKDKIALLCHTDLDGIASAKIIEYVIRPDMVKFLDYRSLNNALIEELKNKKINKVIFADLNLESTEFLSEVEKFAEILIIDHHIYAKDLNSDRKTFLSATGYCAAYICYYMFSKIKEIEKFDWLVAAASISDFCYEKNRRWLDKVCKKYGEIFDPSDLTKKNRIYDLALKLSLTALFFKGKVDEAYKLIGDNIEDVANLENYAKDVWNEIEYSMAKFE